MAYEMYPGLGDHNVAAIKGDKGKKGLQGEHGEKGERGGDFEGPASLYNVQGSPSSMLDYRYSENKSTNGVTHYILETKIKCGLISLVHVVVICRRTYNSNLTNKNNFFTLANPPQKDLSFTGSNNNSVIRISASGVCSYECLTPTGGQDYGVTHSFNYYTRD